MSPELGLIHHQNQMKPEQLKGLKGESVSDRLACVPCFGGKTSHPTEENTPGPPSCVNWPIQTGERKNGWGQTILPRPVSVKAVIIEVRYSD